MKAFDFSLAKGAAISFEAENVSEVGGTGARHRSFYNLIGKRVFDIILAAILLPLLLPIIAVLWLATTSKDGGPGFFGHRRIGRCGKSFQCWKIRTMVMDSEQRLTQYLSENPEAAAEWEREQKLRNDPRVTRLGRILRATSLDELPQIWNIIRGDMSFVGPRPVVRPELRRYGQKRGAYLAFRPGLTGIWQVSGRNDVSYDERVKMDEEYARCMSFVGDLQIMRRTFKAVLEQTGV